MTTKHTPATLADELEALRAKHAHIENRLEGTLETLEYQQQLAVDAGAEIARLRAEKTALQAFKDFVHRRLDDAGIPTHPDGVHSKEGCRIGDRLDIVLVHAAEKTAQDAVLAGLREVLSIQNTWVEAALGCKTWQWDGDQREAAEQSLEASRAALANDSSQ